jgi:Ca-activated chloride channel family protein
VAHGLAAAAWGLASTLAAAGATVGTTVAPAHADETPTYQGTELKTGATIQQAPQVGTGTYVIDAPAADQHVYVTVNRTIPGSTMWFGASFDPGSGITAEQANDLQLGAYADGDTNSDCLDFGTSLSTDASGADIRGLQTSLYRVTEATECRSAKSYTLDFLPYQVSYPAGTKIQLVLWEEPPVDGVSGLPAASTSLTWADMGPGSSTPTEITPGTTWSNAPDISQGTFSFHLEPGSVNVFRMPLDWGQHGQVAVKPKAYLDYESVAAIWVGPMGGALFEPELLSLPPNIGTSLDVSYSTDTAAFATPVVSYRARELDQDDSFGGVDEAGVPGNYYFVIYLADNKSTKGGVDATMQTGYYTDFAVGAPAYKQPPPAMPQSFVAEGDAAAAGDGDAATDEGPPWPIITMLGGGAAIFAVLGAVALGRSRKGGRP